MKPSLNIHFVIAIAIGLSMFISGNVHRMKNPYFQINTHTGALPPTIQKIIAGPFLGSAADYNILQVFTLYSALNQVSDKNRQSQLWEHIKNRLTTASQQDPYFKDIYRITSGLLAFQPGYENAAIKILERGGKFRAWDWEPLFIAGFLAHELINDNKLATTLLQQSAQRPNAPPIAAGVAAKIIQQDHGSEASIRFLEQMKSTLPAEYQQGLQQRINRIEQGEIK